MVLFFGAQHILKILREIAFGDTAGLRDPFESALMFGIVILQDKAFAGVHTVDHINIIL